MYVPMKQNNGTVCGIYLDVEHMLRQTPGSARTAPNATCKHTYTSAISVTEKRVLVSRSRTFCTWFPPVQVAPTFFYHNHYLCRFNYAELLTLRTPIFSTAL